MATKVRAAHILVKSENVAKDLLVKVKGGDSFEDLAKKHSECPSGKQGGDLGWFGRNMMVKEFETAAFEGRKGDVVGPIKTQFGWHVIKVVDQK